MGIEAGYKSSQHMGNPYFSVAFLISAYLRFIASEIFLLAAALIVLFFSEAAGIIPAASRSAPVG